MHSTLDSNTTLAPTSEVPFTPDTSTVVPGITSVVDDASLPPAEGKHDAYTVSADGHFVGVDGFVVPASFIEFFDRFPDYIRQWVRRHTINYPQREEVCEEITSELVLHLMTVPEESVYREPGANGHADGCTDRIMMFNPERIYGVNANRFFFYVNRVLTNRFIALLKRRRTDPLSNKSDLTTLFKTEFREDHVLIPEEELMLYSRDDYSNAMFGPEMKGTYTHSMAYVTEFYDFVELYNPELTPVLDALHGTSTFIHAQEMLGLDERMFNRSRTRLKALYKSFISSAPVPKQRRLYRLRHDAEAVTA